MEAGRVSSPAGAATADCRWLRCTIVISLCGQGISCPSFLCLVDGVAFYHLILGRKKAGDLFQISCSVCRCVGGGYLVIKVRGKLTRCEVDKLKFMVLHRCSYFNQITVQIIKTNYFLSPTMCHKFINILN